MGREEMRAADTDRQSTADRLREALEAGRLDLHEYDERLQRAYSARTYGDLDVLMADLPGSGLLIPPVPPAAPAPNPTGEWVMRVWAGWVPPVAVTTAIWAISSASAHELLYFWPFWVAVPWGLVLIWTTVAGLASGAPRKMVEERERKAAAKLRKRERKAELIARGESPSEGKKPELSDSERADTPDHG